LRLKNSVHMLLMSWSFSLLSAMIVVSSMNAKHDMFCDRVVGVVVGSVQTCPLSVYPFVSLAMFVRRGS
jgi:hypothetical protein